MSPKNRCVLTQAEYPMSRCLSMLGKHMGLSCRRDIDCWGLIQDTFLEKSPQMITLLDVLLSAFNLSRTLGKLITGMYRSGHIFFI